VLSFLPSNIDEAFAIEEVCSYQHSAASWHRYLLYYQSISSALVEEVCSYQHSAAWQALNHGRKNGALLD